MIQVGFALNAEVPDKSHFDRKNYFYPDLPKGYQISQYEFPLVKNGIITLKNGKQVRITRVHLEEDTASNEHDKSGNSFVNFNRAGIPLMELVTEPDLRSAEEAREAAEELQLIFQYTGASRARMEMGEMRVEANVSIMPKGSKEFGTKVELKNINSFKAVGKAIEYEIKRQAKLLDAGKEVQQETRGWDDARGQTVLQRIKESAHDYRYFPEPDLPEIDVPSIREPLRNSLPELPHAKRARFGTEYGLDDEAIEIFVRNEGLANFYEQATSELGGWLESEECEKKPQEVYKLVRNYMLTDLARAIDEADISFEESKINPENFAELITMVAKNEVSSRGAKDLLSYIVRNGGDPSVIAEEQNMLQTSDEGALDTIVDAVIAQNEKAVGEYKEGKENAIQFLVGMAMKESKGQGNPQILREILLKKLS